jgi:hypothetical protein
MWIMDKFSNSMIFSWGGSVQKVFQLKFKIGYNTKIFGKRERLRKKKSRNFFLTQIWNWIQQKYIQSRRMVENNV